jgi:hypothetical protein
VALGQRADAVGDGGQGRVRLPALPADGGCPGGKFSPPVKVATRLNVKFEAVADLYWEDPRHTFKL